MASSVFIAAITAGVFMAQQRKKAVEPGAPFTVIGCEVDDLYRIDGAGWSFFVFRNRVTGEWGTYLDGPPMRSSLSN